MESITRLLQTAVSNSTNLLDDASIKINKEPAWTTNLEIVGQVGIVLKAVSLFVMTFDAMHKWRKSEHPSRASILSLMTFSVAMVSLTHTDFFRLFSV